MTSDVMGNQAQKWREYLHGIADKVHDLILDLSRLEVFREAIRPWAQQYEKHKADVQRLTTDGTHTPTEVLRLATIKVPRHGQFVPKLDVAPHPADTLRVDGQDRLPPLPLAEERTRDFAMVAAIHDSMETHSPRITEGVWPAELLAQVWMHLTWDTYPAHWPRRGEIKNALKTVQGQLPRVKAGDDPDGNKSPTDIILAGVAVKDYCVSRATLRRAVTSGRLRDFRPERHSDTAPLQLSRAAIAAIWPRRGQ